MNTTTNTKTNSSDVQPKKVNKELQEKFIVLEIENENFIIPLEYVSEIVRVQDITEAPHQPEWVRGIMNLRDSVISLIDTKKRLGVKTHYDEARELISNSKIICEKLVNSLQMTLENDVPFVMNSNANHSEFGKWSHTLLNNNEVNDKIKKKLREAIAPHDNLYELVAKALEISYSGKKDEAIELFKAINTIHIQKLIDCFDELAACFDEMHTKNIAVIIEYSGIHFAMLADDITKMKTFQRESRQKGSLTDSPFVSGVYDDEEGLYQELDLNGILKGKEGEPIEL
jgi:purine-binding chemotaxis protein CheW